VETRIRNTILAIASACTLLLGLGATHAEPLATAEVVRDFMVQNVCLDPAGAVRIGRSPIDEGGCARQRDLRPGELLPYHKHDHPSPEHRQTEPEGYQRHDSFPVETKGLGTVVEHSFDFGTGGRHYGAFDRGSDGGDVAIISTGISNGTVSFGATEDGGSGFVLWVGECRGDVAPGALARSWLILEFDPNRPEKLQGQTVARLNAVRANRSECPARLNPALTSWRIAPFTYRARAGQGTPVTLTTLISDHYGGADRDTADHVERFYFTRELGGTRWERWQNSRGNKEFSAAVIAQRAASFAATGRCGAAEPPPGKAPMILIDCREWTRIVPPADPAGDRPGFWIEAIRARPGAPEFFLEPGREKK
jgi:hypothetical protein